MIHPIKIGLSEDLKEILIDVEELEDYISINTSDILTLALDVLEQKDS